MTSSLPTARVGGGKHPRFVSAAGPINERETEGDRAHRHAAMIRAAWARCGHDIDVRVVSINQTPTVRIPGLINGLPARVVIEE
jgi:hypothetical protein